MSIETAIIIMLFLIVVVLLRLSWLLNGIPWRVGRRRVRSRSIDYGLIVGMLAAIQPFIPQLALSQNQIAILGMIVAVGIVFYRWKTTDKVRE